MRNKLSLPTSHRLMKKMKRFGFLPLLAVLFGFSHAQRAEADWKITEAYFKAERVLNVATGEYLNVDSGTLNSEHNLYGDVKLNFHDRIELAGAITVREYDVDTISHRTTTLKNVYVIVDLYGLNFRLGYVHDLVLPLKGLTGKPLSAIFDSKFHGGKILVGAAFVVGATPNYSYVRNSNGIRIPNLESWLSLSIHLALDVGYLTMQFSTESLAKDSQHIHRQASGSIHTTGQSVIEPSLEDLMNTVIGGN